jgi:hypothetical protein
MVESPVPYIGSGGVSPTRTGIFQRLIFKQIQWDGKILRQNG